MAITPTVIKGERREEFGKGSARRLRRDGDRDVVVNAAQRV